MSDKLIGKTLVGRFVLQESLGTGATGAVYRAQQTAVDRVVAVKTLHAFLQERDDFKARFEIEAKAIARLNHPNCITLYDFGYDEEFDLFYMAVEFIRGRQLAEVIAEGLTHDEVYAIVYQTAEALEHAHREGILHRDLKPENVMIEVHPESERHVVKVLDFGLARLYETAPTGDWEQDAPRRYKQITEVGQVYGTPAYMSPEQCRGNEDLTPATDLYALGTMMFELLEGRLPFFSKSTAELMLMQMTDDPPRMEHPDVPEEIKDLVHRLMAKDPAARPQSAREVLATLMPYVRLDASQEFRIPTSAELMRPTAEELASLRATSSAVHVVSTPTLELSSDELWSATSRPRAAWWAIATALLAIGAVTLVLTSRSPETSDGAAAGTSDTTLPPSAPVESAAVGTVEAGDAARANHAELPPPSATTPSPAQKEPAGAKRDAKAAGATKRRAAAGEDPSQDVVDTEAADEVPIRAKTLKLTY